MFDHKSDLFWCYIIDTLRAQVQNSRTQLTSALTPSGRLPQAHCRNTNIYLFIYSTQQKWIKGGGCQPPSPTTTTTPHRPKFCPIMHNLFKILFHFFSQDFVHFFQYFQDFSNFFKCPPPQKKNKRKYTCGRVGMINDYLKKSASV